MNIRYVIKRIPMVGSIARAVNYAVTSVRDSFSHSSEYWDKRYRSGKNSGPGSYGPLAQFKARVLNDFVDRHGIRTVIEFGCGDGNQLALAHYPEYLGLDVSPRAIEQCREKFKMQRGRTFELLDDYDGRKAELALSLDVIFHLVEDDTFESHLRSLFDAASKYVIIYSSDSEEQEPFQPKHVRHRRFTPWVEKNITGWRLIQRIPNEHPYKGDDSTGSRADFFIYEKAAKTDPAP